MWEREFKQEEGRGGRKGSRKKEVGEAGRAWGVLGRLLWVGKGKCMGEEEGSGGASYIMDCFCNLMSNVPIYGRARNETFAYTLHSFSMIFLYRPRFF